MDPQGYVYVIDTSNNRVELLNPSLRSVGTWGRRGEGNGEFSFPVGAVGIAVDASGRVYVADPGNNRVQVFVLVPMP